jgi:hypothetical protein
VGLRRIVLGPSPLWAWSLPARVPQCRQGRQAHAGRSICAPASRPSYSSRRRASISSSALIQRDGGGRLAVAHSGRITGADLNAVAEPLQSVRRSKGLTSATASVQTRDELIGPHVSQFFLWLDNPRVGTSRNCHRWRSAYGALGADARGLGYWRATSHGDHIHGRALGGVRSGQGSTVVEAHCNKITNWGLVPHLRRCRHGEVRTRTLTAPCRVRREGIFLSPD